MFNGAEIPEDELDLIKHSGPVKIFLTFNNQEWIAAKEFRYYDHKVERIAYATFGAEIVDPAEKEKVWRAEEPIEKYPDDMPQEEVKKREEEKQKKIAEENEESQTVARRKGGKIYIYGHDFNHLDVILLFNNYIDGQSQVHLSSNQRFQGDLPFSSCWRTCYIQEHQETCLRYSRHGSRSSDREPHGYSGGFP